MASHFVLTGSSPAVKGSLSHLCGRGGGRSVRYFSMVAWSAKCPKRLETQQLSRGASDHNFTHPSKPTPTPSWAPHPLLSHCFFSFEAWILSVLKGHHTCSCLEHCFSGSRPCFSDSKHYVWTKVQFCRFWWDGHAWILKCEFLAEMWVFGCSLDSLPLR